MGKGTNSALHAISDKSAANESPTSTTIPSIFKSGNILEQHSLLSKGADDDGESRINAFCFPHAGGASHSFAKWEAPMRSVGIRINAATYPGRGSRFMEPAAQSMSQIVQDCLAWMVPEMDRPFILLGHSLGGLVAFEVLRELERQRLPLPIAIIISSVGPSSWYVESKNYERLAHLDNAEFASKASQRGWYPQEAVNRDEEILQVMVPTLKGDVAIFEDFVSQGTCPGHVSVPVHIVGGGADASVPSDALRAWKQLVSNATLTVIEDAGHFHTETHPEEICKLLAKTCHAWYHSQPSSIIHGPYRVYEEEKYCVHELFEQQAARTPDAIMVVDFNEALTFAQARTRSRLIARTLQASGVGVNMEGIVGVLCPPSANFLVAQLGINMAGGAILPFYTNYSKSLIEDLIRTANVAYFICSASYAHLIPDSMQGTSLVLAQGWSERLESEETLPAYVRPDVSPADIAMLAMTSGSTGKPKAIIVSHRATAISFAIRYEKFPFTDTDVIASNIFFVWEALRGPLRGRPVHVIPDDVVVDPKRFVRFLRDCAATRIVVTAQLTSNMLNYPNLDLVADLASMRMWMLCGEVCLRSMARQWTTRAPASAQLYNFYSSWESLDVSYVELPLADTSVSASRFAVAASEPLPNVSIYILDENMQPVPKGIIGETYIGNRGLSDGYLNDDVKNAKHFLPNHLKDRDDFFQMHSETPSVTNKLYRTGDRARILPGWQLEIAGRGDSIVKIRGFKVGLHYVESQLKLVSGVRDAVVRPVLDEESRQPEALVAYITGDSGRPSSDACVQVAESVKAMVPAYAAPAFIIGLETFPTRPGSGKRDLKSFPRLTILPTRGSCGAAKESGLQLHRLAGQRIAMIALHCYSKTRGARCWVAMALMKKMTISLK